MKNIDILIRKKLNIKRKLATLSVGSIRHTRMKDQLNGLKMMIRKEKLNEQ